MRIFIKFFYSTTYVVVVLGIHQLPRGGADKQSVLASPSASNFVHLKIFNTISFILEASYTIHAC